jgi:hypothetical protein
VLFLALAGPILALVLLGAEPDARGHGTHEQLGMAPCAFPARFGLPCPTCGVTTAAAWAARLDLVSAYRTQIFGATLFLLFELLSARAILALIRRRDLVVPHPASRTGRGIFLALVALLLVAWWVKARTW